VLGLDVALLVVYADLRARAITSITSAPIGITNLTTTRSPIRISRSETGRVLAPIRFERDVASGWTLSM